MVKLLLRSVAVLCWVAFFFLSAKRPSGEADDPARPGRAHNYEQGSADAV